MTQKPHFSPTPDPDPGSAGKDSLLAGLLVAAPAWAPWLNDVNEALTTVTLLCGALLGLGRLWVFFRRRVSGARCQKPAPDDT